MTPTHSDAAWSLALAPLLKRTRRVIESEISGISMGSTLPAGTRIRIQCEDPASARQGSVVAIMAERGLIGHRLLWRGTDRRGNPMVLTRGDGSPVCDPPVAADRILGEITHWYAAPEWRAVPPPPRPTPLRRASAALALTVVRMAVAVDVGLATRGAAGFAALYRRLVKPNPSR
jgi:hypothetical protein